MDRRRTKQAYAGNCTPFLSRPLQALECAQPVVCRASWVFTAQLLAACVARTVVPSLLSAMQVQLDIRNGHAQTVDKVLLWLDEGEPLKMSLMACCLRC